MTQTLHVNVTRRDAETTQPISIEADLAAARQLAELLDAKFTVGGVRFGLDAILGVIPVVGDTVSTLIGVYPLMLARKHKLGRWVQARMAANLAADWAIGLVPLVGDAFDIGFKANLRNFALLEKAAVTHRHP